MGVVAVRGGGDIGVGVGGVVVVLFGVCAVVCRCRRRCGEDGSLGYY